jgi:flavin-dependent dehydrogenase
MSAPPVLILGGGPAGCIAGIGLARLGHAVRLLAWPPLRAAIEGFGQRIPQALEAQGCGCALASLGPAVARSASWAGRESAANREQVVDRTVFDHALLTDAQLAGVEVIEARIERLVRAGEGWQAVTADGAAWPAALVIEARGRRAPGRRRRGPATTALGRLLADVPGPPRTALMALPAGWAWYAANEAGIASLQVALAPPLPKRAGLAPLWQQLRAELAAAIPGLADGHPIGAVFACAAEPSVALAPIEPGLIRIGDAALAMDPLAGHGVFEAIASATAAVPVANTLLRRPAHAALATAFCEERQRLAFERFARIGRDFYAQEQRWPDAPFWQARRTWPDALPAHLPPAAAAPVIATRPVIEDGFVVARPVVVTADQPRGVWQVDQVPVVALLELVLAVPDAAPAALATRIDRPPERVATALAWLRTHGLIPAAGAPADPAPAAARRRR